MAGVIKKLYHPIDNGTVTTAVSQELQEVYPITATSAVYAPAEAPAEIRGKSLEQILNLKQNLLVSGQNIKTINGNSLLGSGDLTIGGGGGGSSTLDQYLGFDAENNAVYVKGNYGFYSNSFISAGGVGSGGGGGGSSTLAGLTDTEITNPTQPETLVYNNTLHKWVNRVNYRAVGTLDYSWTPGSQSGAHGALTSTTATTLNFWEGNGISITIDEAGQGTSVGTLRFHVKLQSGGGLAFNSSGELYSTGGGGSSYTLPTASSSTKGGVKIGTDLSMNGEFLSVDRSSLKSYLDGYFVHLTGAESVNGLKTFVDGIAIGNNTKTITLSSGTITINGDVQVNGNFYATGNVTAGTSSN